VATGAAGAAATTGLDFFAAGAAAGAAATATGAAGAGAASDFLETFLTFWALEVEAGLLIVLLPVEVFDINKRGMIFSKWKSVIKFCE
jgi:hypothetical protein